MSKILVFQPPSPPGMNINREWAGALGLSSRSKRRSYGHDTVPMYNLFLLWTAGALQQRGYKVTFVDGQAEQWSAERAVREVARGHYDCLVALLNLPSIHGDLELLRMMRAAAPKLPIIAMGTVCSVLTEMIARSGATDYVAVTEPEETVPEIVNRLFNEGNGSGVPGAVSCATSGPLQAAGWRAPVPFDALPRIPYELVLGEKYYRRQDGARLALTLMSKGCPFGCAFYCPYPLTFGRRVRTRRPEIVATEIERLVRDWGTEYVVFRDQNFTLRKDDVRALCDLLLAQGTKVRWACETRVDLLPDANLLALMRRAGCEEIHFGLESGNPEVFESIGKPGAAFAQVDRAMTMVAGAGMGIMLHVIVGFPQDTWTTIRQTARVARRYKGMVNVTALVPYPGTLLYEEARRGRLLRTRDWSRYSGSDVVMRTRSMSHAKLQWAVLYLRYVADGSVRRRLSPTWRLLRSAGGLLRQSVAEILAGPRE